MAINRRYSLICDNEDVHIFPIFEKAENKFYKKNNLVDLDYLIYSQTTANNAKELRLFLINYYKSLLILVDSQVTTKKQLQLRKTIVQEIKYLMENEHITFKIVYKNNNYLKRLNVHYKLTNTQKYFLDQYNFYNQIYEYDTKAVLEEIKQDENFNKLLHIITQKYSEEKFNNYIIRSKVIDSYLKSYLSNYSKYLMLIKNNEYIRNDERDFYENSFILLQQRLLGYRTLRTVLEQINIYYQMNKDNILYDLEEKIRSEEEIINEENYIIKGDIIASRMEELYGMGYNLQDFKDADVYPDGLGIRKK